VKKFEEIQFLHFAHLSVVLQEVTLIGIGPEVTCSGGPRGEISG